MGLPCSSSSTLAGAEGPGNWAKLGQEEQRQAANSCWEPTEPISRAPLPSRPRLRTQEQQEHETNPGSYRYGAASPEPRRAELAAPCWKFLLHKTSRWLEPLNLTAERAAYGREGNSLLVGTAAWRRLLTQLQSTEGSWGQPSISWFIAADRGDRAGKHRAFRWLRPREGTGVPPGAGNRTSRQRLSRRLFLQAKISRRLLLCSRLSALSFPRSLRGREPARVCVLSEMQKLSLRTAGTSRGNSVPKGSLGTAPQKAGRFLGSFHASA